MEGVADFAGDLASGGNINAKAMAFGLALKDIIGIRNATEFLVKSGYDPK